MNNFYRVSYNGIGVYEAYRNAVSIDEWKQFLNSKNAKWLPKPVVKKYKNSYESYFTEEGYNNFKSRVLPIFIKTLDYNKIEIMQYKDIQYKYKLVYEDNMQVVVDINQPQKTISEMISNFKESHQNELSLFSKPSLQEIANAFKENDIEKSYTDEAISNRLNDYLSEVVSDADKYKVLNWPSIECPFFTDDEIEELKDYYNESGSESYHNYFIEGEDTPHKPSGKSYGSRVIELQNQLKITNDPEEVDRIKQNLIDLGWNPEIEYTAETQIMAKNRFIKLMTEKMNGAAVYDIQSFIEQASPEEIPIIENRITRTTINNPHPVSIIFIQGNQAFSGIIQKFTNCDFSHAALALDGDFTKLYSFNFENNIKFGGGFSLESIKNYPQENRLGIYTFFVNDSDYNKIQERLQYMLNNIKSTTYSVSGLLLFPFNNIKFNMPEKMICSQFVDACIKMINVDITNTHSSKVSPALLYNSSIKNAKIYKTYDGKVKDFNHAKVSKLLKRLAISAKGIKSESSFFGIINIYITEARQFPIEVRSNGDVLLTNPMPDFDAEYMASHKLLMQYDKAGNIEPIKYELARLYYMNYILEKKLYHNKFLINKEKNMKTRARVLNDFNKYIKVVLKSQPEFNFAEYYEDSQFYPHTIEVKGSTIDSIKSVFKYIL